MAKAKAVPVVSDNGHAVKTAHPVSEAALRATMSRRGITDSGDDADKGVKAYIARRERQQRVPANSKATALRPR